MKKIIELSMCFLAASAFLFAVYIVLSNLYICGSHNAFNRFKVIHWPYYVESECGDVKGCVSENKHEGKVVFGINERHSKDFFWMLNFLTIENKDSKKIEKYSRKYIYVNYFKKPDIYQLDPKAVHPVFDYAVHSGVKQAVRELQKNIGVYPSGRIDKETILVSRQFTVNDYNENRAKYIRSLPMYKDYRNGMETRISNIKKQSVLTLDKYKLVCR